eukprot:GHVU01236284.1.p1 GENE.GHVU01236284.1~~GHVU01236284.1.p1  ORF type:complete len:268 (-),score=21.77 GHVU01236284.1:2250-3053(-)
MAGHPRPYKKRTHDTWIHRREAARLMMLGEFERPETIPSERWSDVRKRLFREGESLTYQQDLFAIDKTAEGISQSDMFKLAEDKFGLLAAPRKSEMPKWASVILQTAVSLVVNKKRVLREVIDGGDKKVLTNRRDSKAQVTFKNNLLVWYDIKCVHCGFTDELALTAAHIMGHASGKKLGLLGLWSSGNGLIMCGTCDDLFGTEKGNLILVEEENKRLFWYYSGPYEGYRSREGLEFNPPEELRNEICFNLERRKGNYIDNSRTILG